jgi:hypothetical protein
VLLGDLRERSSFGDACVREEDVEVTLPLLHRREQTVQVRESRDVALQRGHVPTDLLDCRIELFLASTGNEDVSPLCGEKLRRGEPDAGTTAGDDRNLSLMLVHDTFSFERWPSGRWEGLNGPLPPRPAVPCNC